MILLRAAILLFVPGILKCLEKPWALKNATVASIMNSSDSRLEATLDGDDRPQKQKDIYSQEEYVQASAETVANPGPQPGELFDDEVVDQPYHLFVDLGHPYSIRLRNLQLVAPRNARADVHGLVRSSLSKAFDRLYTKHKASFGGLLRAAIALVTFVVIGLFQRSHRGVYDRADVVDLRPARLHRRAGVRLGVPGPGVGPAAARRSTRSPSTTSSATSPATRSTHGSGGSPTCWGPGSKQTKQQLPEPSLGVTRLVYDHVAGGWKDYILKPTPTASVGAYRQFNDIRGQRTLDREGCRGRRAIEESLRMPFDDSVLVWHLSTEFCYFDHVDTGNDATRHSRMVSNYMAYLLFVKPEMLIPGARCRLFRATYHELSKMLKLPPEDEETAEVEPTEKKAPPPRARNEMVRKVIQKVKPTIGLGLGSEDLVHKAWAVAHELMEFAEDKKQDFIQKRKNLRAVVRSAREKADQLIIDVDNNNKADQVTEGGKKTFKEMAAVFISEAEKFISEAEKFISEERKKKRTKEEEKILDLLESAKKMAEFVQEEKKTVVAVKEFTKTAEEVIEQVGKEEKLKDLMLMIRGKEHADDKMWAVIQGVWVEMLCFSAGRCRGPRVPACQEPGQRRRVPLLRLAPPVLHGDGDHAGEDAEAGAARGWGHRSSAGKDTHG